MGYNGVQFTHNTLPSLSLNYIKVYICLINQLFCSGILIVTKLNQCSYNPIVTKQDDNTNFV